MSFPAVPIILGYIDPGSGAMLVQWIIAVFVGAGFYCRRFIARIFQRVFRKGKKAENQTPEPANKP